jgi:hypothetical protein
MLPIAAPKATRRIAKETILKIDLSHRADITAITDPLVTTAKTGIIPKVKGMIPEAVHRGPPRKIEVETQANHVTDPKVAKIVTSKGTDHRIGKGPTLRRGVGLPSLGIPKIGMQNRTRRKVIQSLLKIEPAIVLN